MSTLTISAKGKVKLPKAALDHLGVKPGGKITVDRLPGGRIEVKAAAPSGRISDAFGFLRRHDGSVLTIEEINQAGAEGWATGAFGASSSSAGRCL